MNLYLGFILVLFVKLLIKNLEFFAINKIPLNDNQKENVCKEFSFEKLSDFYVVQCFDVWIEKNYLLNHKNCGFSSGHKILDKQNTLLLYIQMDVFHNNERHNK